MSYEDIACDANNLYKAYLASVKGSKWKESTQRYMLSYLYYNFQIADAFRNRTLVNGIPNEFFLKERGRLRPISSLPMKDRVIRHVLCDDILLPEVKRHIIYDNSASLKGRGISFARNRFEVNLKRYYRKYGNDGWILFGDFSKFYDNIIHDIAKEQLLELFDHDDFIDWILTVIFDGFKVDVSYMSDEEYANCMSGCFNKNEYRKIPKGQLTGEKWMRKSVNIGDQLSQVVGIYYPNRIDTYIKYVESEKFYGRYNDDWYIMSLDKDRLIYLATKISELAEEIGLHANLDKLKIVRISGPYRYLQIQYRLADSGKVIKKINPKRVTTMRKKLKCLAIMVKDGRRTYESVENLFKAWMGSNYKLISKAQRKNMIKLYEDLFDKTVTVVDKKLVIFDGSPKRMEVA